MSRRVAIVLLFAAFAPAACSGGGEETIPRNRLAQLVLQPGDLPQGFGEFDVGRQLRLDAHPGPREDPGRFGRIDGWKARFRWGGAPKARRPLLVESRADLFDAGAGAEKDLDAYREELESPPPGSGIRVAELGPPKLGDETLAFRATQGSLVFFTVAWRRANATASLVAEAFAGRVEPRAVYALARRQARRLDRAAR